MSGGGGSNGTSSAGVYRRSGLREHVAGGGRVRLDGATGTELERRGLPTGLPLWSAPALVDHPEIVRAVHAAYAAAGVDALTANTFRTQRHVLAGAGQGDRADALTRRAVELAREAAQGVDPPPWVLGSAAPLEDCYRPDRVPGAEVLATEHAAHLRALAGAGVDAVLVETMNTVREAVVATRAAGTLGLAPLTSFVCWEGATLLDGSPLRDAARAALDAGAIAVLVNCLPPSNVPPCLEVLAGLGVPFGVYANLGEPDDATGFARSEDCSPDRFAALAREWADAGASLVGGCCGTTPDHLAAACAALAPRKRTTGAD